MILESKRYNILIWEALKLAILKLEKNYKNKILYFNKI